MTPSQPWLIIICLPIDFLWDQTRFILSHAVKSVCLWQWGELHTLWLSWGWVIRMCLQPHTDKTIIMCDLQHRVRSSVCTTCQSRAASLTAGCSAVWVEAVWCNNMVWEEGALPLGYFAHRVKVEGVWQLCRDPNYTAWDRKKHPCRQLEKWARQ